MYLKKIIAYASEGKPARLEVPIYNGDVTDDALDLVAHFVAFHEARFVKTAIKLDGEFFNIDYVNTCADIVDRAAKYRKA